MAKTAAAFEIEGVDDLVLLPKVTEADISENIKKRYMLDKIYTNIGPVLLSVNPFRRIPGICDTEQVDEYRGRFRYEVPPNIFALAEEAYRQLKNIENQCVIITGESGAGKTEAAKLIMKYVSAVSGESNEINYVKDVINQSNPLLESFGNAKTLRNNNSSRFGKYFEIQFDRLGDPVGGKINHYLLEKSRVVRQIKGERSFHVFYQMLSGCSPQEKQTLQITEPKDYYYLKQSECYTVEGTNDVEEHKEVIHSMNTVGITSTEQQSIYQMLAGVLHLGNIQFSEQNDKAVPVDMNVAKKAAAIICCNGDALLHALTSRVITTGTGATAETYNVPNNRIQAEAARDSLSKAIYSRIFDYIVEKTNQALGKFQLPYAVILGVLDIYGFEIFDVNGFEQFCINYVNEKLQQYFIELTLKAEQEEYKAENIQWTPIKFFNNKVVCDLIEGKSPPGMFSVLDDVCFTMHAVESDVLDFKFVEKCSGCFNGNIYFQPFEKGFRIKHYAGEVAYTVTGFCDRNKDVVTNDIIEVVQASTNSLLVSFFPEDISAKQAKRPTTAGFKIKSSAQALIKNLSLCTPHYIRTIKPNETKRPKDWDDSRVNHQVKYLGLLENVRVRRAGYAFRAPFDRFLERYKKLSDKTWGPTTRWTGDPAQGTKIILESVSLEPKQWQLGKTKVFIRHPESLFFLEECLERFDHERASVIQKAWRSWKGKKKALETRQIAANLMLNKKERRRDSIQRSFDGDYLNYDKNFLLAQGMAQHRDELLIFGDQVIKFNKRGRAERRDLVTTIKGLYLCQRVSKHQQTFYRIGFQTPLNQINSVSISPYQDNMVVVHSNSGDAWFECDKKTELVTLLSLQIEAQTRTKLNLNFNSNISVKWNNDFIQVLNFSKDESAHRARVKKQGKNFTIYVSTGLPASTNSAPQGFDTGVPSSRAVPASTSVGAVKGPPPGGMPPKPAGPQCRALFDYQGDGENQLSFFAGDIITILQKDPAGWWEGELRGKNGWIPANYVEEI
ncbi:myosin heavy chain IB-like [Schistocerca gregaria]|uniref:myosin heavy chain IB-like n=1 Tax=Schistocerca gregaria TaxID=7010 RepID=UPI00211DD664|nr:myosin heavy chain IB-like [Schistocerca gregaria]